MDPIRIFVVLAAFAGVGAFAFLAAQSERKVDAGSAVGILDESVTLAETAGEVDPLTGPGSDPTGASTAPIVFSGDAEGTPTFPDPADKVEHSEEEWRELLSPEAFNVLREAGTEWAGSSPLDDVKEPGWFVCAGCNNLLYETKTKFDSHTGWPSFWKPVAASHIIEKPGHGFDRRVEVLCARCGGHLGHVFNDGPTNKTGLRYCMNGVAMKFIPKPG